MTSKLLPMTSPHLNQILMAVTSPLYLPQINDETTTPLDDNAIEEGDEHSIQITSGLLASMMSIENPETFNEIVCVAPAKGQRPLSIMTDSNFDTMSNPEKFPISDGCFAAERPRKLTYRRYFNQRLLDVG